jgi:hypothetical protein
MGVRKLDRGRYYALVYGDPKRKFMQDGMFFDGIGVALDASGVEQAQPEPTNDDVAVVERDDSEAKRLKELNDMSVPALKTLAKKVSKATDTKLPEGGTGAKARLVTYIAKHTE